MSYLEQALKEFVGIVKQKEYKQQVQQIQQQIKSLFQQIKGQPQVQQKLSKKTIQTLFNQAYRQIRSGQDKYEYICINLITACLKTCEEQGTEVIEITLEQTSHIIGGTLIQNEQYMLSIINFINQVITLGLLRSKELEQKVLIKLTTFFQNQKAPRSQIEQSIYKLLCQMFQKGDAITARLYVIQSINPECQHIAINGNQISSCGTLIAIGACLYCVRNNVKSTILDEVIGKVINIKPGVIDEHNAKLLYSMPANKLHLKNNDNQQSTFVNADYFSVTKFVQNLASNKVKFQTAVINTQLYHCFLLVSDKRLDNKFKVQYIQNFLNSIVYFLTVSFQLQNQVMTNVVKPSNQQSISGSNENTEITLSKSYINLLHQNPNDGSQISTFVTPIYNFSKLEPCIEVLQYLQFYLVQLLNNFILYKNLGESEATQIIQYFYWLFVGNGIIDIAISKNKIIQRYLTSNTQFNIGVFNQNTSDMEFLNTIFLYNEGHIQDVPNKINPQISFIVIEAIFQVLTFVKGLYIAPALSHKQNIVSNLIENDHKSSSEDQTETSNMGTTSFGRQGSLEIQYGGVPYLSQESIGYLFEVLMRLVKLVQNTTDSKHVFSVVTQTIFNIVRIFDQRCLNYRKIKGTQQESIEEQEEERNALQNPTLFVKDEELTQSRKSSQSQQQEVLGQNQLITEETEEKDESEKTQSQNPENQNDATEPESQKATEPDDIIENSQPQSKQVQSQINPSVYDSQSLYRRGYVDDFYEKTKRYALQLPKLVADVDQLLPWAKTVQIQNQFTVSCVFNQITQTLPKLHCMRPQEVMDALLSIVSIYISFYQCNVTYNNLRSSIQQHSDDQFARGITNVMNFNEIAHNEELIVHDRSRYVNVEAYLQALCGLIHSDLCNPSYKDLFSHVLINEIDYLDNDVQQVFGIITDQLNNMSRSMLNYDNLRDNFKLIIVQLLRYQLCAQQPDALQNVPIQYTRINAQNAIQFTAIDLYQIIQQQFSTQIINMNNSEYYSRIMMNVLEFSDQYKLNIAESVQKIIEYTKKLYESDRMGVTQTYIWYLTSLLQQINTQQDYQAYDVEHQICIFEILTDLITNLYDGQLNNKIDSQAVYQLIETFYLHIQDLQVLYQLHQFVQLQACNQISNKQVSLLSNYVQLSKLLLMKTQESSLLINTIKENLCSIIIYSLMHMYYNKIGSVIENGYILSQDQQLIDVYYKYTQTSQELVDFISKDEKTSLYVFMIPIQTINLIQKNIDNNQAIEIVNLQVSFLLSLLTSYQMVNMLLNQDTSQAYTQFITDMQLLSEQLGPQFNYANSNVPDLIISSELLTFIAEKIIYNKAFNKTLSSNIQNINKLLLNLIDYVENVKFTDKNVFLDIMKFISKVTNSALLTYETYYKITIDDSQLFVNQNKPQDDNMFNELNLKPHPHIILAQTFGNYLIKTLPQLNKALSDMLITDNDILDVQQQIKTDILETMEKTINAQTYKYYAKIIYYILVNANISTDIKKSIYLSLINIIQDSNVNDNFGNKHVITVSLLLYTIKHEILDNITIDTEYKKWICDQLLGPTLKHITNTDMKSVFVKQQLLGIVYKLVINGQADLENHIFPILSQLMLQWTPNSNATDYQTRIYVDQNNFGALDLKITQESSDPVASVSGYKQYGDKAFEYGIQIIKKFCTQDAETLSQVGKNIDPNIKAKAEQFYIKHYKQIQKQYQKGHGHQENLIKYCELIVDVMPQHITKVFTASCNLFEMDESLAPFRTKYLQKLGQQCGFE